MYNIIGNLHVLCKRFSRSIRETERLHKSAKALTDITLYNAAIAKFENKHGIGIALAAQTTNPSCKASIKIHDATIMGRDFNAKASRNSQANWCDHFWRAPWKAGPFLCLSNRRTPIHIFCKGIARGSE